MFGKLDQRIGNSKDPATGLPVYSLYGQTLRPSDRELSGIDALVFTAGIGEHSPEVRAAACEPFAFLGLRLDAAKNSASPADGDISSADSPVRVLVIRAQEDWAIARECWRLLHDSLSS